MILDGRAAGLELYKSKKDKLEEELTKLAAEAFTDAERAKVTEYAISMEKSLLEELESSEEDSSQKGKAGLYYRMYWKKQNKMLESKRRKA